MMEVIRILAAVFAAYEFYKMLNPGVYLKMIKNTKEIADQFADISGFMADPFVRRVLFIEIVYTAFAFVLIFTAFWYFTLILFAVSLAVFTLAASGRVAGNLALSFGSAICALLLMRIVIVS